VSEQEDRIQAVSPSLYGRLARNLAYLAGGTGLAALFNMLALAFNVRALSLGDFGLLVLLQTSALTLRGLLSFGTQQPVIQLGSAAMAEQDFTRVGRIIGLALSIDLAAAITACATGLALSYCAGSVIGLTDHDLGAASIFAAALLFMGYLSSNGIFRLLNRFDVIGMIEAGSAAVILCASALFYSLEADFIAYVWVYASAMALNLQAQLWTALYLLRKRGITPIFEASRLPQKDIKSFISYCWSNWGTASLESARTNGDSLLVGWLVSIEGAGLYNVAKQTAGILRKVTAIYGSALYPEVAKLAAEGKLGSARRLRARMMLIGAAVGVVCVTVIALVGEPLLSLTFGPRFAAAYWALVLLVFAAALQMMSHTLAIYVQVYVSPARLFWIYLAGMIGYGIAAPLGALKFGLIGAAIGQVIFSSIVILLGWQIIRPAFEGKGGSLED